MREYRKFFDFWTSYLVQLICEMEFIVATTDYLDIGIYADVVDRSFDEDTADLLESDFPLGRDIIKDILITTIYMYNDMKINNDIKSDRDRERFIESSVYSLDMMIGVDN